MLTRVAEGILVHQSELLQNNTTVVQGRSGVLLVDPGITGAEMECLAEDLRALGLPVVAGFATHPDWDHVLWHAAFGEPPRFGTVGCASAMRELRSQPDWKAQAAEGLPPELAGQIPLDRFGDITGLPAGTSTFPWDGPAVRVIEHPAHSAGHAALLVGDRGVLVAGDMLSDVLIPMLDDFTGTDDPVEGYLEGLRILEAVADGIDVLVPGHGSVAGGDQIAARIGQDRAYLYALRDGNAPDDPRLGDSAQPGWEWVSGIHTWQAQLVAERTGRAVNEVRRGTATTRADQS
ncbi:MBL fold metallo-hydrolase [Cellulomonas terrae]|uniref:MBL fold metallo-hydrolase n=1 Tax=Cellulomonas terrae TaxID=311234 RepID=A0A511JK52_9CELL|nr:MBL fold metallo-hydrolase [Cellulomonas terrae]GEL98314.1 MBL fold metallo-hydrolase [Cellulomonas terrae]